MLLRDGPHHIVRRAVSKLDNAVLQGRVSVLRHLAGFVNLILPNQTAAEQNLSKISLAGHDKLLAKRKRPSIRHKIRLAAARAHKGPKK